MKKIIIIFLFSFVLLEAQEVKLVLQTGHGSQINAISFSPDGKIIASASADETIKIWHSKTGLLLHTLIGHQNEVMDIDFSATGDTLVSCSKDKEVKLWDVITGKVIASYHGHQFDVNSVDLSPDGKQILSAGFDNVRLWDIDNTSQPKWQHQLREPVFAVRFLPDGKRFATGSADRLIKIWNIDDLSAPEKSLSGHNAPIRSIRFNNDGTLMASYSLDSESILWDLSSDSQKKINAGYTQQIALSSDGKFLAVGGEDEITIEIKNTETLETEIILDDHFDAVICVDFSGTSQQLVSGSIDGEIKIWNINDSRVLRNLTGVVQSVTGCKILANENQIITSNNDNYVRFWNMVDGSTPEVVATDIGSIFSIAVSPDGKYVAAGGEGFEGNTISIIEYETLEHRIIQGHMGIVTSVEFSYDSQHIISAASDTVKIFDVKSGKEISKFTADNDNYISSIASHPYEDIVAIGDYEKNIYLWDISKNQQVFSISLHDKKISALKFSITGDTLISASEDGSIRLWDSKSGMLLKKIDDAENGQPVLTLAVSPDGQTLASGGYDNTIYLRNLARDCQLITRIPNAHANIVALLSYTSDSRVIMSGSTDGMVKLWDLEEIKPVVSMVGIDQWDWAVVAPDGHFDGSPDGVNKLHWVESNQPLLIEAYFEKLFFPTLLAVILPGQIGYDPSQTDITEGLILPPKVDILSPEFEESYSIDNITLTARVKTMANPLAEIRVYLNNKLVVSEESSLGANDSLDVDFPVYLLPGENIFKVIAIDKDRTESYPSETTVYMEGEELQGDLYVISVGISEYEESSYNLMSARSDADSITTRLISKNRPLAKQCHQTVILDNDAVKNDIIQAFEDVAEKSRPEDVFVFFYAGHGKISDGENKDLYLVLHDVTSMDELENKGISAQMLGKLMEKVKANKQLVVLDACQSAKALENLYEKSEIAGGKASAQLARRAGLTTLTSTAASELAFEIEGLGHGLFTYVLLEGLEGKADQGDNLITIFELKNYIDDTLPGLSRDLIGKEQTPNGRSEGRDFFIGKLQ